VRQEEIADPLNKIKDKKEYKACLQEMVRLDFPDEFPPKKKINAQSDLYTYFYIRALRLLNPRGIHTFICSNSWLDVGYGVWLQEFLLNRCPVDLIIDNHAKRSFEAAAVNTIISVIHAPRKKVDPQHLVKFVAFKKPFEEAIYTENLLAIEDAGKIISNKTFRVYPITVKELKESGTEYENEEKKKLDAGKYEGDKWGGKYLRAPDIFFTILEKGKDKLVKLGKIADVRRGFTTGVNEFFYLDDETIGKWKIEPEYLKPVIKSPRECKSIIVDPKNLKYKIFMCNKSKAELKGTNALKYIEWGEKQKTEDGVYWKDVPTVSNRRYWYVLGERKPARINFNYLIDEIGVSYLGEVFVSDNFQEVHTEKDIDIFLNSFVFYLFQLNTGRVSFGGGLLKIQTYELNRLLVMEIKDKKIKYLRKNESSIFDECGIDPESKTPIEEQEPKPLPDRAELDKIVFDALDLTKEERKEVYRAVCRLVWNRISKARSV
jgi:Eco57I restriction endonuclease.